MLSMFPASWLKPRAYFVGFLAAALVGPAFAQPTLTTPAVSQIGANQATFTFQSDADGTGYFTLLAGFQSPGNGDQTKLGKTGTGAAAFRSGSLPLKAGTPATYTIRNLTAGTPYAVCFTAEDGTLVQPTPITVGFPTTAATDLAGMDWAFVGVPGAFPAGAAYPRLAFAPDGTPHVSFMDDVDKATVMKYTGTGWEVVGARGFSTGKVSLPDLAFAPDGTLYVGYTEDQSAKATVMKFNGTAWSVVGSAGFSPGIASQLSLAIAPDGAPHVAFSDHTQGPKATVMKFNGAVWVPVGSPGFSAGANAYRSLAFAPNGELHVAFRDAGNEGKATVMKYTGAGATGWEAVGSPGFSAPEATATTSLGFAPDGTPCLVYSDSSDKKRARVVKFNGSAWIDVGDCFTTGQATWTSLAMVADANGTPLRRLSGRGCRLESVGHEV